MPRRIDEATLIEGVRALVAIDPDLRGVVERHGHPPLWARPPGFDTLVRIILEQQVSVASGRAAYDRLVRAVRAIDEVEPATIVTAEPGILEAAGLTRQKSRYLGALAAAVHDGTLDLVGLAGLDDAVVRETLCAFPGISAWTADVYLLMALGRPDAWPAADIALMTSVARVKGLPARPSVVEMSALADAWRPWRAVAARILWHAYLSERPPAA